MIALLLAFSAGAADLVDRIAAVVDDHPIALSEVYELGSSFVTERCPERAPTCVREAELEVLDSLVKRELIRAELDRLDIAVTGTQVDQAIDGIVAQDKIEDRAALRAEVEAQGMRWDSYRDQIQEQLATRNFQSRVLAPRVSVTEDELRDAYQKLNGPVEALEVRMHALGILVPGGAAGDQLEGMQKAAESVISDLNTGKLTWDQAVQDYDSAHLAEVLATRPWREGQLIPQLDKLAFAAPVGVTQPPVLVNNLIVVFQVDTRDVGKGDAGSNGGPSFEDVRGKLQEQIFSQKLQDAEEEWYQIARRQASVIVLLESP